MSSCLSDPFTPPTDTTTLLVARYLLIKTLVAWQLLTNMHECTHTHTVTHMCTHAHMHAHTHTRAHTHTHTHTHTPGTRGNFVIAQLGSSTSIQCPTLGNIASTIWLDSNNGVFNTSQYPELIVMGSVMILSNVTERVHGLQFQCRGYDASGRAQQWHHYSIVVSGE